MLWLMLWNSMLWIHSMEFHAMDFHSMEFLKSRFRRPITAINRTSSLYPGEPTASSSKKDLCKHLLLYAITSPNLQASKQKAYCLLGLLVTKCVIKGRSVRVKGKGGSVRVKGRSVRTSADVSKGPQWLL
jgi:hypothetical protein